MNNFNWAKGLGFGIIIWVVMLVIALALGWIGVEATLASNLIVAVVAGVLSYLIARTMHPYTFSQMAGYGLLWAIIGLVLDLGFMHGFDFSVMSDWQYWLLFAAVFVGPLVHGLQADVRNPSPRLGTY
jgi:hypothetical protein